VNFNVYPDAATHPPATAVTPEALRESEGALQSLRAEIERERDEGKKAEMIARLADLDDRHRKLAQSQVEELRRIHFERERRGLR